MIGKFCSKCSHPERKCSECKYEDNRVLVEGECVCDAFYKKSEDDKGEE